MGVALGGCTVATRNYLGDARLAARSFCDHHPDAPFTILVVDGAFTPEATWTHRSVELVTPQQLGLAESELLTMAAIYDPAELACALKPLALRRVLERADVAVYLDGDVEVLSPMVELVEAASEHAVVLVPHVLDPMPRDHRLPGEDTILNAGMFNGGVVACGSESEDFLAWWEERLRRDCLFQPSRGLLADQRWLDFVPVLFDHAILRDPTYDVAYWNLHERPTTWTGGQLCVVDRPVRCFHYSGLTDTRPWRLTTFTADRPRLDLSDVPAVARQCRAWLGRRRAIDADADRAIGFHWARTAAGVPLDQRSRTLWRDALLEAEADPARSVVPPGPFGDDDGAAWVQWLREPPPGSSVGRYLLQVWAEDPTLQWRFPAVDDRDRAAFLTWMAADGGDASSVPDAFRPTAEEVAVPETTPAPWRRPPRPAAGAQQPLADVEAARAALDGPRPRTPGALGKVVDRVLAGRDQRAEDVSRAVLDALTELTQRVADLSDRLDRANDVLHDQAGRSEEAFADLVARDDQRRAEAEDLGRRLVDVESASASTRADLDGALEQDRITAGIVADAESRLDAELDDLRRRVRKLSEATDEGAESTEEDQPG